MLERYGSHRGASSAPLGLLNPSTSRKAGLGKHTVDFMDQALKVYSEIERKTEPILTNKGVFKPVPKGENPDRWKKQYLERPWPEGWSEWVEAEKVQTKTGYPNESAPDGGILIHQAWYLKMNELRLCFLNYLQRKGVKYQQSNANIDYAQRLINLPGTVAVKFDSLIHAEGIKTFEESIWQYIPAHGIKGQMLQFNAEHSLDTDYAITNSGYAARTAESEWTIGSTYEHHYKNDSIDDEGALAIRKKGSRLLCSTLYMNAPIKNHWAAIRVGTKDRQFIVGRHPQFEQHLLINGAGSKGLLHAPYAAKLLAELIAEKRQDAGIWGIKRFTKYLK